MYIVIQNLVLLYLLNFQTFLDNKFLNKQVIMYISPLIKSLNN